MKINSFITGSVIGLAAGAAASYAMNSMTTPKGRREMRHTAGKALRAMGDVVDSIATAIKD